MSWLRVFPLLVALMVFAMLWGETELIGQPDPRQMSGLPLPDPGLPDGTITVRVIRGQITDNVTGQLVELRQGDSVETAITDSEGRATFLTLNGGQAVQASTELNGQRLQSRGLEESLRQPLDATGVGHPSAGLTRPGIQGHFQDRRCLRSP